MNIDKDNWRDADVNIDSLWMIGPRAKGGKRDGSYHGNFVPQIPDDLIRRFTEEGQTVLELFMGSGTTLFECERLRRNYIGFDINAEVIETVSRKMEGCEDISYFINNCDVCDDEKMTALISEDFGRLGIKHCDMVLAHPPYLDIIKFTDKEEDLSNLSDISSFLNAFAGAMACAVRQLKPGGVFAFVAGDVYRNSEVVPLAFYMMHFVKKSIKCKLKGIIVKDIVGNRAKIGQDGIWRYRALKTGTYLFKHEYIFVFKK